MNEFWTNVSRYPRFFISSLVGLIFVILTPFRNLLKIKKLQFALPLFLIGILAFLYFTIATMVGL